MATCLICGNECFDKREGKFPFLVWEEPNICSECVEVLEDERLGGCHEILVKDDELVNFVRKTVEPGLMTMGYENVRLAMRHGELMLKMDELFLFEGKDAEAKTDVSTETEYDSVNLDYTEVITEVLQSVCEQDEAVKEIGRIIFHNQRVLKCKRKYGIRSKKQNAFIVGPTGTGKTMSVTKLCEYLGIPYVIVDSTDLTQAGYVGKDVDEIFLELIAAAHGNIEAAEGGIVILDEFDKKESRDAGSGPDVSGKCVLDSLLKAVESKEILLKSGDVFDTTGVTFFALGVYPKLKQIRMERLSGKKTMGFSNASETKAVEGKYLWADLERHGVTKELCGRFPCIIEFSDFTREGYRNILLHSDDSEWKCQKELFEIYYGLELEITEEGIDYVLDKAKSFGIGARGLNAVVTSLLADVEKDVLSGRMKKRKAVFGKEGKVEYCD